MTIIFWRLARRLLFPRGFEKVGTATREPAADNPAISIMLRLEIFFMMALISMYLIAAAHQAARAMLPGTNPGA
jgi:hypothetical protein